MTNLSEKFSDSVLGAKATGAWLKNQFARIQLRRTLSLKPGSLGGNVVLGTATAVVATAIPGCDKGVFDNCDYGKGTFSMEAAADSVQESPQGTVTIPFFLKADDISCDDALLEVRVTAVSTGTGDIVGEQIQQISGVRNGDNRPVNLTFQLPQNCNGIDGTISIYSDENSFPNDENFQKKFTGPYHVDVL